MSFRRIGIGAREASSWVERYLALAGRTEEGRMARMERGSIEVWVWAGVPRSSYLLISN